MMQTGRKAEIEALESRPYYRRLKKARKKQGDSEAFRLFEARRRASPFDPMRDPRMLFTSEADVERWEAGERRDDFSSRQS